eukprot:TRINITY_DN26479_c0_g1_i1.p1 TRINITY_DN26479_c0_g1~~TRINITY_DN26479_c0_g1_i1.p1  ORF type:complete len:291 (-),score=49.75 TRINITY_DN26479_c0_g1_i1:553-1425(-)
MASCSLLSSASALQCRSSVPSGLKSSPFLSPASLRLAAPSSCSSSSLYRCRVPSASLQKDSLLAQISKNLAALALAASLLVSSPIAVNASESNILQDPPPLESHVVDDAGVLSRVTKSDLKRLLTDLEERTGYHIDVVTLRKITTKGDVFEFADQIIEKWYPTIEEGDKRGVVLLITTAKEGAIAGGPAFNDAIGDDLLEAIISENLPVLATAEKYNEALYSTAKRLVARLDGEADIPGPRFDDEKRVSNFKTKEETSEKRGQFTLVVGGLLAIAFVVPMAQYYAYVSKK